MWDNLRVPFGVLGIPPLFKGVQKVRFGQVRVRQIARILHEKIAEFNVLCHQENNPLRDNF